jgi:hypothetical protein
MNYGTWHKSNMAMGTTMERWKHLANTLIIPPNASFDGALPSPL